MTFGVVIAASWSAEAAGRTVASASRALPGADVVVASDPGRVAPIRLSGGARWVLGSPGDGVPRLRRVGADAVSGGVVAFLEDACEVAPGWGSALVDAFRLGDCLAATGPVEPSPGGSATDWSVYFAEYATFAPGRLAGSSRLAGINFACRRDALDGSATVREAELSVRLAGSTRRTPGMLARHVRNYDFRSALVDRWRFGREFGRERWSDRPGPLARLGHLAGPAILGVQLARLAATVSHRPGLIGPALAASPATLAMLTAWSAGEALGWAESRRSRRAGRPDAWPPARPASRRPNCKHEPASA